MSHILGELSDQIATAVERASGSVVQVYAHRRPAAGIVFAPDLVAAPARALGDDTAVVRLPNGDTVEGHVLGQALGMGLGVVRVPQLNVTPTDTAPEPRVGSLAVAIGRTWSGAVMATVTNVAVVGGPLRTGRANQIDRVIRIAQPPHGALSGGALADADGRILGLITGSAIRGTTVVIPATLAWDAAHHIVERGGTRQGYLGITTTTVAVPERQRAGTTEEYGLLVTTLAGGSPADSAGLCVGDILLKFAGEPLHDPDTLVTLLRGDHIGKPATLSVQRGLTRVDVNVVIGERPKRRA
jgi:S1-C subfamily serine protease